MEEKDRIALDAYWKVYLETLPKNGRPKTYEAWAFGSGPGADELAVLVRDGIKTATCSLLWEYEFDEEDLPQVGQKNIVLDGSHRAVCVAETTEVAIRPFDSVDAGFAHDEGEGDRSLTSWREGHWDFFGRICTRIGRSTDETMPLVCERLRIVYVR